MEQEKRILEQREQRLTKLVERQQDTRLQNKAKKSHTTDQDDEFSRAEDIHDYKNHCRAEEYKRKK